MPSGPDYDRRVAKHLADLQEVLKVPRSEYAKALGVGEGQISKRFSGKIQLTSSEVLKILDVMKVEAREFYGGVTGGFHAELYLARLEVKYKEQVKYGKYDLLRSSPSKSYDAEEIRKAAEGLQELRLVDPDAAKVVALDILRADFHYRPSGELRSQVLARVALGAIFRAEGYYGRGAFFLRTALRLAGSDASLQGRVLQAISTLACDQGDFRATSEASREALSKYAQINDIRGLGRALISRGVFHLNSLEYRRAIKAYRGALVLLPKEEWFGKFAAFHGLGLCSLHQGDWDAAHEYSDEALAILSNSHLPALKKAEILWMRGEVRLKTAPEDGLKDLEAALDSYFDAQASALDIGLISLRLAFTYQNFGHLGKMRELAERTTRLLKDSSPKNEVLRGALTEFLRLEVCGEISPKMLLRAYERVLKSSDNAPHVSYLALA